MSTNETTRRDVAELFGEGEGAPAPRTLAVAGLLSMGLIVAVLGMACTAVPGGVMVLFGWMLAEKEMDRIESGYLPADARGLVRALRTASFAGVLMVVMLFVLQGWLFCSGYYDTLWLQLLDLAVGNEALSVPPPAADPTVIQVPPGAPGPPPAAVWSRVIRHGG